MTLRTPSVDERLAEVAARQHGRVTHAQLRAITAVLTAPRGAVLGLEACAEVRGLRRRRARLIDVLVVGRPRPQSGIRFHRLNQPLHPLDVRVYEGIPCTSVARLLVDLTDVFEEPLELANVIHEAARKGEFGLLATRDSMARANGRHNLKVLEAAIDYHLAGSAGFKSLGEKRFFILTKEAGLPEPLVNVHVHGFEVDVHWPHRKLVIEIDGDGHGRSRTRRDDAHRDRVLIDEGWTVLRFPDDRLDEALRAATAHL